MASKKPQGWRKALPRRVVELQKAAEKEIGKRWGQALELMPPAPRKAVKQLTANMERTRHDLRKRGDKVMADVRKRTEDLTTEVQKRIEGAVSPLTRRFDVATRADVDRLRKRLEHLERRLEQGHNTSAVA